jgi:hypothetical protein
MSVVRYRNPSEVIAFLETLDLTPGRLITAHELLAALAFEKQYPTDAARLETLLAPVLCSNETETRQFQRRFREWVEPPPPVAPPPQAQPLWRRPRRLSWKSISRVTILVLAVTLSHAPVPESLPRATSGLETSPDAASFRRPPAEVSQVGFVVSGARAVEKAVLWYRGTTTRSDRGGYFTLRAPQGSTYPLLVTHMQYEARLLPIHMGGQPVAIQVSRKAWLPDQPTSEPTIVLPALRNPWPAVLVGEAAVVLFAGVGLWMLIRAMRFRRWATRLRLGSESLGLGSVPDTLFPSVDTRRVAAHLRRSRRSGQDALAVGPTVRRSTELADTSRRYTGGALESRLTSR